MKKLLGKLASFRLGRQPKPLEVHKTQWHPLFYKAVKVHILETTAKSGRWS